MRFPLFSPGRRANTGVARKKPARGRGDKGGEGEKAKEERVSDFRTAMKWLIGEAERGTSRQRYKGLGEMNPEQLWETTPPAARAEIEDAIKADKVFHDAEGDEVEPRRYFIETNAFEGGEY